MRRQRACCTGNNILLQLKNTLAELFDAYHEVLIGK